MSNDKMELREEDLIDINGGRLIYVKPIEVGKGNDYYFRHPKEKCGFTGMVTKIYQKPYKENIPWFTKKALDVFVQTVDPEYSGVYSKSQTVTIFADDWDIMKDV